MVCEARGAQTWPGGEHLEWLHKLLRWVHRSRYEGPLVPPRGGAKVPAGSLLMALAAKRAFLEAESTRTSSLKEES